MHGKEKRQQFRRFYFFIRLLVKKVHLYVCVAIYTKFYPVILLFYVLLNPHSDVHIETEYVLFFL